MPAPLADNLIVQPGEVIGGKYRVERDLGAGGMGIVVVAAARQSADALRAEDHAPRGRA